MPLSAAVADAYVERTPVKAAAASVHLLASESEEDRERGEVFARALRRGARCAVCGRDLKTKASVARGVGPDCWRDRREEAERALAAIEENR